MSREIIITTTLGRINKLRVWGLSIVVGLLTLRAINDFMSAFNDPETGLKEAFRKSKKRIYASLIAITVESLVVYIKYFYK